MDQDSNLGLQLQIQLSHPDELMGKGKKSSRLSDPVGRTSAHRAVDPGLNPVPGENFFLFNLAFMTYKRPV